VAMKGFKNNLELPKTTVVKIDILKDSWRVTVFIEDVKTFSCTINRSWEELKSILERYIEHRIRVVYDVAKVGFWLHERLIEYGAECDILPPCLLIP
jgi:hypothetical protein